MFQIFEPRISVGDSAERVARLRQAMQRDGLTGIIVTHADEHQSEYLPASAERLAWLTNFSGSAGAAVVLATKAAVFVDGRYTLQAATEVDTELFTIADLVANPPAKWLASHVSAGDRIGYDPMLLTVNEVRRLERRLRGTGAELVATASNLIDELWTDRPEPPVGEVTPHPLAFAGAPAADKLTEIGEVLRQHHADAALLTLADSIAWTFNIRGSDVAHNPVPLTFAIIPAEGRPTLYVDGRKLSNAVRSELSDIAEISEPGRLQSDLVARAKANASLLLDPAATPAALASAIADAGGDVVEGRDPTVMLKARKNAAELAGMRRAHLRDGVAVTRFLAWLDREAPSGSLDEIAAVEALERFRTTTAAEDGEPLAEIAFDTIAGAGPNGAIVHYRVNHQSNRPLEQRSLFLIDSGGQYRDGTTDITRTIAIGEPSEEMRRRYTLVLKGMIDLSIARFPHGTNGAQLDTYARHALWNAGLDYDHGTGHGVGAFLSVHEGPARISKTGTIALEPGMILSNEPGYYKTGAYGIRIENLVAVIEAPPIEGGERPMLGFETLTLAPLDRRLIVPAMLSAEQHAWVNAYHARLRDALAPRLAPDDLAWLERATMPI